MLDFTLENISAEEMERLRAVYEPLTQSVRELIDATVRTQVDAASVAAAKAEINSATARLRHNQADGTFGVRYLATGERMAWGNAVIGIRNPIAPPVQIHRDASGKACCDFHLGAARLGQLHAEAVTTRVDGVKTFAAGHLADDEGVTVEAEGVFILPRWARDNSE